MDAQPAAPPRSLTIGLVGPCAAGKSTLSARLKALGYRARNIAQEHSYVPYMWQRIAHPDLLIYLEVSYAQTLLRRKMNWSETEYREQLHRLRHARLHAHLVIDTDPLSADQVLERVLAYLQSLDSQR